MKTKTKTKTKTKLLIGSLIFSASTTLFAGATTFGSVDCGQWINNPSSSNRSWLLGFLSGLNMFRTSWDPLDKLQSADQAFLWMDNYCRNNPLDTVTVGAINLFFALANKERDNK